MTARMSPGRPTRTSRIREREVITYFVLVGAREVTELGHEDACDLAPGVLARVPALVLQVLRLPDLRARAHFGDDALRVDDDALRVHA